MVRYLENPYSHSCVAAREGASIVTLDWLVEQIEKISKTIVEEKHEWDDAAPYTGLSGVVFALLKANSYVKDDLSKTAYEYLHRCKQLRRNSKDKQARYLCGDLGVYTVQLTFERDNKLEKDIESLVPVIVHHSFPCDELLYGRAGYLAAALWLKHMHNCDVISVTTIRQVCSSIVERGRGNRSPCRLMWTWHDSEYLGAAHGVAGILHLILSFADILTQDIIDDCCATADWMLSIQDEEGNFPSSSKWIGREREESLVHWCHGAPGVVYLLITMYKLKGEQKYLQGLFRAGELIWQRGVLKKGPGICHGIAGNGYALLSIWRVTGDQKWLDRALCFARLLLSSSVLSHQRTPDTPYSLFEGWSGALCYLVDILHPDKAQFPLFACKFN